MGHQAVYRSTETGYLRTFIRPCSRGSVSRPTSTSRGPYKASRDRQRPQTWRCIAPSVQAGVLHWTPKFALWCLSWFLAQLAYRMRGLCRRESSPRALVAYAASAQVHRTTRPVGTYPWGSSRRSLGWIPHQRYLLHPQRCQRLNRRPCASEMVRVLHGRRQSWQLQPALPRSRRMVEGSSWRGPERHSNGWNRRSTPGRHSGFCRHPQGQ